MALARPKSSTFTVPSGVTLMLAGFRSRWMMPRSCAYSMASAICLAMASARSIGSGPFEPLGVAFHQLHDERVTSRCPPDHRWPRCWDD